MPGRDVCRAGTFAGAGRLLGRNVCRGGTFAGTGYLPGGDVFYPVFKNCLYGRWDGTFAGDGTFFIPCLKTVYMGGGTGRLPVTGRFLSQV